MTAYKVLRDARRDPRQYVGPVLIGILVLAAAVLVFQSFYTVAAHEQAVLLRFGRYHSTQGPGLHFKIPFADSAAIVEMNERSMRLPFGITGRVSEAEVDRSHRIRQDESLVLTGDLYAGVVEWNVIWRVVEPKDFLFSIDAEEVERLVTAVARSTMHRAAGDYSADELLTGKREEIGLAAFREMQKVLDSYESGISIVAVQMQRVTPPERVKPAFDEVNASIQQRDQLVNEAHRERNRMLPTAEANSDRLIRQAEGYAARRRAEAEGEIAALLARYRAYSDAPDITRRRLYLEAMENVMLNSGPKTVLDAELGGLLPLLNLDQTHQAGGRTRPPAGGARRGGGP
ncbi:MAG: FtsH protease activity modulator HflK [Planctomycetes bacterium]|nr:FtsH protease activity modulator HflK [Planctomycetota bacterium]